MRLKEKVAKRGRELQGAKVVLGKTLKLQPAVISQQRLKEAWDAQQREAVMHCDLRETLNRGAEVEPGRFTLTGYIIECPRCGCFYTEDGHQFFVGDSNIGKGRHKDAQKLVPIEDCPRCTARVLIEDEISNAATEVVVTGDAILKRPARR